MPIGLSNACFYVATEPVIEVSEGMFHVCYSHGDWRLQVCMPPRTFLKALRRANEAAGDFEDDPGATVIPLREPEDVGANREHR